jgi:hypothetical protein
MKLFTLTAILALSVGAYALQETDTDPAAMQASAATEEHAWLQQLVGDWTSVAEVNMGPGVEPMKCESSEHARALGDLWVIAEAKSSMGGTEFTSLMTVGYDARKQKFVGSWVDTMLAHMWSYTGTLDEKRTTLTLEAEGPDMTDPTKNALYRDVIEMQGKDKKILTSSMKGPDGNWIEFMRAEGTRKAKGTAK